MITDLNWVMLDRDLADQVGQHYEIQENRINKQILKQNRDKVCQKFCPVEGSLDIVELAMAFGVKEQIDPLCVFQTDDGTTSYLTGARITS